MNDDAQTAPPVEESSERDRTVREILSTTLELAKELQRELGRLQHIVDTSIPGKLND